MLVLVSDLHLVDTPDPTDHRVPRLIGRLEDVAQLAATKKLEPLSVAFLGDIFDVLHSQKWLDEELRPWELPTSRHKELVRDIYLSIDKANPAFLAGLRSLKGKHPAVTLHYLPGNHDRVLNTEMGELARREMAQTFPVERTGELFQDTLVFPEYATMCRHGHELDPRNVYAMESAAVGDAVVIELLEQLPRLVAKRTGWAVSDERLKFLRELNCVLPQDMRTMTDWIFRGIAGLEARERGVDIRGIFEEELLTIFAEIDRLRTNNPDLFMLSNYFDWLMLLMRGKFRKGKLKLLFSIGRWKNFGIQADPFRERNLLQSQCMFAARFFEQFHVLAAGHTHEAKQDPDGAQRRQFVNTGAWNRIHYLSPRASYDFDTVGLVYSRREQTLLSEQVCRLERGQRLLP
jgi:UDP-2,3-diacylglucosamine pyrophosphatase LpxH